MIDGSYDYANDSLRSLAKPYLKRLETTENLYKRMKEIESDYLQCKKKDEEIEKILAARITKYCVFGSEGQVITAKVSNSMIGIYDKLEIKQAIK